MKGLIALAIGVFCASSAVFGMFFSKTHPQLLCTSPVLPATAEATTAAPLSPSMAAEGRQSWETQMCALGESRFWRDVKRARLDQSKHGELFERLLHEVVLPEVVAERPALENATAPLLPVLDDAWCRASGFGPRMNGPAPLLVVDVVFFGVDVDMLEVRILELQDVVDMFVIFESPLTHSGLRKGYVLQPLMPELRRRFPRARLLYAPFTDLDLEVLSRGDSFNVSKTDGRNWNHEVRSRQYMFLKVLKSLPAGSEGFVISGDTDEIPARETVWAARHCAWPVAEGGPGEVCTEVVQYQCTLGTLFRAGHSPKGKQLEVRKFPLLLSLSELRRRAARGLTEMDLRPYDVDRSCDTPRGVHLSWFGGLWRTMFKLVATVEGSQYLHGTRLLDAMLAAACHRDEFHRELNRTALMFHPHWAHLVSRDRSLAWPVPWAIRQNPRRYASFLGQFPTCGQNRWQYCDDTLTLAQFLWKKNK